MESYKRMKMMEVDDDNNTSKVNIFILLDDPAIVESSSKTGLPCGFGVYIRNIMIWVEIRSKLKGFFPKMEVEMVKVIRVMALLTAIEALMKVMIPAADREFFPDASTLRTVRVWQQSDDGIYNFKHMLTAEVRAVTIHPTDKYFISASLDRTWKFYDLSSDFRVIQVACVTGSEQFLAAAFHPDGHIIGTGTSKFERFWDVAKQDDIIKIDAHAGPVTSIAFLENGFHLETAAEDGVKLWDLCFLRTFMTFPSDGNAHKCPVRQLSNGLKITESTGG